MRSITEFDLVFLSYDEPKAEEYWANLLAIVPWAKRVHGIKGFDTAHKKCAQLSESDWFVTVDGDNSVNPRFFDQKIIIDPLVGCYSWKAKNSINGLAYGNGGLKLWNKNYVLNDMNSHENSLDNKNTVDFCWEKPYVQLNQIYSTSIINQTAFQAFRSGFREGVKLCLDQGNKIDSMDLFKELWPTNLQRLFIWSSIGSDVEHGKWSIYGARLATYLVWLTHFNYISIRDYDWFAGFYKQIQSEITTEKTLDKEIGKLGAKLSSAFDFAWPTFTSEQSFWFKTVYINPIQEPNLDQVQNNTTKVFENYKWFKKQ